MHFSSVAAFLAVSSYSITYAAPVANLDDLNRRQINYQVVNVDGESNGSTAPEIETVTTTLKSTVTAPGAPPVAQTVTVTATPSLTPSSSPVASSSTPISHQAPPPGESFMPANSNGFFRRGLNAAGNPGLYAQNYASSSASWPTSSASLAARNFDGPASSSYTPSSTAVPTPTLAARQYGRWSSSIPGSSSTAVPTSTASPLVARQADVWGSSSSVATPSGTPSVIPSSSVYARGYVAAASSGSSSGLLSGTPSATPSASVYGRGYVAAASGTPSGTPSSSASITASPTPFPVKRDFEYSSSVSTPVTPSSSFSIPRSSALMY
ncbi:hypothetical protein N7456_009893 [Penicillium angulare]|uniref:Uncharacterized protein n=1 Tax=Penicillium angulare TaxID=116970 RepID=A0A9W9F5P4_9EURO|nr:hypothetical protein N7456_009893 [Penicillium angulare]